MATRTFSLPSRLLLIVAALFAAAALGAATLRAQNWNGNLEGHALDPTGAAIPGASVELRNTSTGQTRSAETSASGFYSFPLLPVGTYDATFRKAGFAEKVLRGLELQVGQTVRLDVRLEVEHGHQQISVAARTPLVQTASPALGDEIGNRSVSMLPLNGRQFSQLALLAAGAVEPYPNSATQQFNTPAMGIGFSVNGQRSERNNFTLDGVTLMEPFAYSLTVNPSVDAIREFQVLENSYSAAQGLISGAQVNIATRSGGNQFHGTAYEYFRNSALDARNFFDDPSQPIPPFRQNQFGASLGGPLHRDRTFYFMNYEGLRIRQSVTNRTLLPTAAMRSGDFSGLDPLTSRPFPTILNPATAQPFPGNRIPVQMIDPLSAAVLAREPLPNLPNAPAGEYNNLSVGMHSVVSNQFTVRLDHRLTPSQELFARLVTFQSRQLFPFVANAFATNPPAPPGFGTNKNDRGVNLALGSTSVLSSSLVNDFRFAYVYFRGTKAAQNINSHFLQSLGIARAPGSTNFGIPAINVPGYADLGDSDIFQPFVRKDHIFQFNDNLVWVHGRNTWKFGADFRRLRLFYLVEDFGQGVFSFSDAPSVSGTAFSDFLLGRPFLSFAQAGNSGGNDRLNYLGAYVSDEFHATRRLTLTLGLREEFYTPALNADGRASILDPTDAARSIVRNDLGQAAAMESTPIIQTLAQNFGLQFITSQQAGLPASLIRPDYAGWAPRFGFAYDLTGRGTSSLRGGIGVFNSLGELDYTAETRLSPPITEFLFGLDTCRFYGPGACGQPYAPPPLSYSLAYQLGNQAPVAISSPPNIRNGYVYEWSLSLEHQLAPNTLLEVSTTGSEGHKLPRRALQNQGLPNLPGLRRGQHPQPGSNQFVRATDVNSNYNALVVRLERRVAQGLSFSAGYTWGKSIDTASGLQGTNQPQDNYNMKAERGLSDFDVRHRFVFSSTWQMPFGDGRRWLNRGWAKQALGNWEMSNIVSLNSGQPMTVLLSTSLSGTGSSGTDRPDLIANPNLPAGRRDPNHWFSTAAFRTPPIYTDAQGQFSIPGNEGRNVVTGPGLADWDLSLERSLRLTERGSLVLRADFFNLLNHPNFNRPGLLCTPLASNDPARLAEGLPCSNTSDFGKIHSAMNSRQIQFSLRLNW